ncbi:cytochrome b/b6 domain-containing protein [Ascidiaceihabitans sp.]|uniref:cytochrome b/b6 domain-containing protein n=1 Tax=Ascidiaceihabitans sp. TaxID=1872644 RepID=UPI003297A041
MSRTNSAHHYGSVTKTFHWLTALLILTLIPLGIIANKLPYETSEQLAQKAWLFSLHKTLGVTVFFVALARIAWAVTQTKPAGLHPDRKAESWLAETVHWLLYGSLLLVPLSGWIHHASTTGFAPIWWPFGQNLPLVAKSEDTAALFAGLHIVFERVLAVSLILHVAGALKHHFVDKDATLKRMWFGTTHTPNATGTHKHGLPFVTALAAWGIAIAIGSSIGVFAKHGDAIAQVALEEVISDWTVETGTVAIEITQFGNVVEGSFADWTADIDYDPATAKGTTTVTIAVPSLTLGSVTDQAMGPDFFDATTFPTAIFQANLERIVDGHLATGTLTIRDKTVPIELPFNLSIDDGLATVNGQIELNRQDFSIGDNMADESSLLFNVKVKVELTARQN